tara:strand:+ start:309 stop:1109 length:801 start_codon:yes stop_codon:yes gene_type:complete
MTGLSSIASDIGKGLFGTGDDSFLRKALYKTVYDSSGKPTEVIDVERLGGALSFVGGAAGLFGSGGQDPTGYQGSIPNYTAVRAPVQRTYDPNRRPGSMGRRYFSDVSFQSPDAVDTAPALNQAVGLASIDPAVRRQAARPDLYPVPQTMAASSANGTPASGVANLLPVPQYMADGGIVGLKEGMYLEGATDGMADEVPASVDNVEPAALSDGEYVIPADVVSHLGNGNSDAGAKVLDKFLLRIRKERTGNSKQGKQIDPNKLLPA